MSLPTASETLQAARTARARGDVDGCLRLSTSAASKAGDEGDWSTAFWAMLAPAAMHMGRAEPEDALGHYRNALDVALEHGLCKLLGESYHGLYLAARDCRNDPQSRRYRATSFELYRDTNSRNPRLVALMADWAEEAFDLNPCPETAADALQHWRACPTSLPGPKERMLAACNLVVASAWLNLRPRYREGLSALESAFGELPDHEYAAVALAHASTGAARMKDYPRAASLAERALRIAVERQEGIPEMRAREALSVALADR